ncbi:MAG: DUF47 domain-containing protein [Solirubrobacterales bacterium]
MLLGRSGKEASITDTFAASGRNTSTAAGLLCAMLEQWPDDQGRAAEIAEAEHRGDRLTRDLMVALQRGRGDLPRDTAMRLASTVDDILDDIEEAADLLGLYRVEAPMEQALRLAEILAASASELAGALEQLDGLRRRCAHRQRIGELEDEGDRVSRAAVASLFGGGIDPMVVIRWKDIYALLERAIDGTEAAAHLIEGMAIAAEGRRRPRRAR